MTFKTATASLMIALVASVVTHAQESQQPSGGGTSEPQLIEFDAPHAATNSSSVCAPNCGTFAYANNDLGAIVGYYTDNQVVPHGFLRDNTGRFISFDAPGAGLGANLYEGTAAYAINDQGMIAGAFEDAKLVNHGFVRMADGQFQTFDALGAGTGANQGTFLWAINLEGRIAGVYVDSKGVEHGYVRSIFGGDTTIDPPGSTFTEVCLENCLTPDGTVAGFYADSNIVYHGFVRSPDGTITPFDAPGASDTFVNGVNRYGAVTGTFWDANLVSHGFVRSIEGKFTMIDVPGAGDGMDTYQGTQATSINEPGAVSGSWQDTSYVYHGYFRSPQGVLTLFDAPDAGKGFFLGTHPATINVWGEITGSFNDASALNHAFVWSPGICEPGPTTTPVGTGIYVIQKPVDYGSEYGEILRFSTESSGSIMPERTITAPPNMAFATLATDGSGNIYTTAELPTSVELLEYKAGSSGCAVPERSLPSDPTTRIYAPDGIDASASGKIYLAEDTGGVGTYSSIANGDEAPQSFILGACEVGPICNGLSTLIEANAVAADLSGTLYIQNEDAGGGPVPAPIAVFSPGATGNVAPERTIGGLNTLIQNLGAMTTDAAGDLYVTSSASSSLGYSGSILVFAPGAKGDAKPIRIISGSKTQLGYLGGIKLDSAGNLYVISIGPTGTLSVLRFPANAKGDVAPTLSFTSKAWTNPDNNISLAVR